MRRRDSCWGHILAVMAAVCQTPCIADDAIEDDAPSVISEKQTQRIDESLSRAMDWLTKQQADSGAFPTDASGQPGVTSLCLLAYMAQGHRPGEGKYGAQMDLALHYVLDSQKKSGLIARAAPDSPTVPRAVSHNIGRTSSYNHAISGLMLAEIYGMTQREDAKRVKLAIEKALAVTLAEQRGAKVRARDRGGWRYLHKYGDADSDLSVVGWQLAFLRSAKNAGFDVPKKPIDNAVEYVRRCIIPRTGQFQYSIGGRSHSRGMTGAGVLALAHAGQHDTPEAKQAAKRILSQPFDAYNTDLTPLEIYHYSVFYCTHAMYQMGGEYWKEFFPRMTKTLLENQNRNGSWAVERHPNDVRWGNSFTTAMVVLSLSAPNEMLPIFQR